MLLWSRSKALTTLFFSFVYQHIKQHCENTKLKNAIAIRTAYCKYTNPSTQKDKQPTFQVSSQAVQREIHQALGATSVWAFSLWRGFLGDIQKQTPQINIRLLASSWRNSPFWSLSFWCLKQNWATGRKTHFEVGCGVGVWDGGSPGGPCGIPRISRIGKWPGLGVK